MLTATHASPHARMTSVPAGTVTFDGDGPLAQLHAAVSTRAVATMGAIFFDADRAHAYQNFQVAGGDLDGTKGEHRGAPFMDGDFYKWLEAAVVAGAHGHSEILDLVDRAADAIVKAQQPDGYLQTKTTARLRDGGAGPLADRLDFETYNFGHLMTLACVAHRATGDSRFLDVARRLGDWVITAVAEHPDRFADCNICPSHYMGVIELARETGQARLIELARTLLALHGGKGRDGSDDNQDVMPVADLRSGAGHAVRATYLYAGMTDAVLETGDESLRTAVASLWDDIVSRKLYVTGGCGALYDGASPDAAQDYWSVTKVHQSFGRAFQLPQTTAYNESCATLGFLMWAWRMLLLTGQGRFADEIERVLFNSLPAMIGADATTYLYTNPVRQVRDLPYALRRAGDAPTTSVPPSHDRPRQAFMDSSFCCPPNIVRAAAELPYYCYAVGPSTIWVHQFVNGTLDAHLGDTAIQLTQHTTYPSSGTVTITVNAAPGTAGTIRVRIPGWAGDGASITVDGDPVTSIVDGYAVIERQWHTNTITLDLPMQPRLVAANHLVEEASNQVAVMVGPMVFCVESADLPEGAGIEEIYLSRSGELSLAAGEGIFAGYPVVQAQAVRLPRLVPATALYADLPEVSPTEIPVRLVPYARWGNRGAGEMSVWLPLMW